MRAPATTQNTRISAPVTLPKPYETRNQTRRRIKSKRRFAFQYARVSPVFAIVHSVGGVGLPAWP
jgi:hypothetical protein